MRYLLSALLVLSATGCSSIVTKPDIHHVKRVAIVSFTAPQKVPYKSGRGEVSGWNEANRLAVADAAYDAFAAEFQKLNWDVIPKETIAGNATYKEHFQVKVTASESGIGKALNTLATMSSESTWFSPTGLYPIVREAKGKSGGGDVISLDIMNLSMKKEMPLEEKLKELAGKLDVDSVVAVQMDYCYDGGTLSLGGTGTAVMTGISSIYAVNRKGIETVKMEPIAGTCAGGDKRVESDASAGMVQGNLLFGDARIQQMFREVAKKAAASNVKEIQEASKE